MKLPRRNFLQLAAGAVALSPVCRVASAETYPLRPVLMIVGLPPANSPDIVARLIGQWLSQRFGQSFVIENRPGASGNIATEFVVRAPADGYTLLLITVGNAVNGSIYKNLNYNFIRDIAPVASIGGIPLVMVVTPSLPVKTVPEFIAYAKVNPGKINMASSGNGSLLHVAGALFEMMTGVNLVHVPYRESIFPDLLGGQVQVAFIPVPAAIGYLQSGKLRPLGITTTRRIDVLPDVPAISEFVASYEVSGWLGVGAPKKTPAAIIDTLNKGINAGLADPQLKARLSELGVILMPMIPAELEKYIAEETEKWAKVIKFAGIKLD